MNSPEGSTGPPSCPGPLDADFGVCLYTRPLCLLVQQQHIIATADITTTTITPTTIAIITPIDRKNASNPVRKASPVKKKVYHYFADFSDTLKACCITLEFEQGGLYHSVIFQKDAV